MSSNENNRLLITHARLIDGTDRPPREKQSILIRDGVIAEIAERITAEEDVRTIDAGGATVLPGLIDAHVHLQAVPGSVYRKDSEADLEKYRYHQLRAYPACGVTTVLDNAISAPMLRKFQEYLSSGGVGPRIYALAPALYPPNGFLDNNMLTAYWGPQWGPAGSREEIDALFDSYEGLENIVGVKTFFDSGPGKANIWLRHSPEIREVIRQEALRRELPLYIHAFKPEEQQMALDVGVHNLVHPGFFFDPPSEDFIAQAKKLGTYVTTTLTCTFDQMLVQWEPDRLEDDLLERVVPKVLLDTPKQPDAWNTFNLALFKNSAPKWMPDWMLRLIPKVINMEKQIRSCLANATNAVVTLHQAGIPIAVGTDASNWPLYLNFFHGASTIREIELLGAAGISPQDVIASASRIPSEMMGIDHLVGTVEVGKRADLIIIRDDPLKDLSALRSLMWTIKDGDPKTPQEWLGDNTRSSSF